MDLTKYQARREILARRRITPTEDQHAAALAIAEHFEHFNTNDDDIAAIYSPIEGEVPTNMLADALKAKGVKVAYPHAMANGSMSFRLNNGTFAEDQLGIMAPTGDEVNPTIVFAPLVAFDRSGNRIGYGKGYYDKALAHLALATSRPIRTIGLAYSWQEVPQLTPALHDVPLDQIWTEKEIITCLK